MARIKILSDSTCDLTPALLQKYDITLTPLTVVKDGKPFRDGVDITPADIFAHVDGGGALCSTSAVSEYEYATFFSRYAPDYDAVVQITIGSGFSTCYQNASIAAVMEAVRLAEAGQSGEDIARALRELAPKVEASFLVERLDYLYKGGRCSAVAALGANLLGLKPCIEVSGGKMGVCKKYRGSFESAVRQYVRERLEGREDIRPALAFVTHPAAPESVVRAALDTAAQYGSFDQVIETHAGCTVSCHCGPHTLGILFVRK